MIKRGMPPIHPGAVLREMYMDPLGVSVTNLADNIGVARRTVSLLVNEHSGVSAEMALRLGKAFDTTPELWLDMQQKYDLWYAGKKIKLAGIRRLVAKQKIISTKPDTVRKSIKSVNRKKTAVPD